MTTPRKRVPATAPQPQDHKQKSAAREAEAEGGFVTVEQCGVKLRVPIKGKVPLKALIAFNNGDEFGGTEILLGQEQWATFLAKDPTLDDFLEVAQKVKEAAGN